MDDQPQAPQQPAAQSTTGPVPNLNVSVGDTFKNCWELLKSNAGTYIGLFLIPILPFIIGAILLSTSITVTESDVNNDTFSAIENGEFESFEELGSLFDDVQADSETEFNAGALAIGGIIYLVGVVLAVLSQASVTASTISTLQNGTKHNFSESFAMGRKAFWPYLLTSIVLGLAVMAGFILLIVPGVIFILWWGLSTAAAIDQRKGVGAAFSESKRLTEGNWGTMLGIFFSLMGLSLVLGFIPIIGQIASMILSLVSALFLPYLYVAMGKQKEGMGGAVPAQAAPTQTAPEAPNSNETTPPTV